MPIPTLYAPWRMDYIKSLDKVPPGECFLCQAAVAAASGPEQRRAKLVLWDTPDTLVVINRYPYSHGHLLIAPKAHKSELGELTEAESLDIHRQTTAAIELLRRAVSAQGFNIGVNIGRVAGAGLPGHVHQHIVPRWNGDANFMSVVGEIHVVPQALSQLYKILLKAREDNSKASG